MVWCFPPRCLHLIAKQFSWTLRSLRRPLPDQCSRAAPSHRLQFLSKPLFDWLRPWLYIKIGGGFLCPLPERANPRAPLLFVHYQFGWDPSPWAHSGSSSRFLRERSPYPSVPYSEASFPFFLGTISSFETSSFPRPSGGSETAGAQARRDLQPDAVRHSLHWGFRWLRWFVARLVTARCYM